nr:UGT2 [Ginkgo biloba]|eukprot:Gb_14245 [translate_table: standard]
MDSSTCSKNCKQFHVLMFPWLAHGHISPYVELSKRLADEGINISFVSTPLNISKIRPLFADYQNCPPGRKVQLLELPLPTVDGLPAGIENTRDIPPHLLPLLDKAMDGLEKPFERLLRQICPNCVIFDFVQCWTPKVAAKMGIPTIFFVTFGTAFATYAISPVRLKSEEITAEDLMKPPPDFPSSVLSWRYFEAQSAIGCFTAEKPDLSYLQRGLTCYDGCCAIAVKTCNEIEGKFIQYLEIVAGKPVFALGPLLPGLNKQESDCLKWLDKQSPSSVVYVSFGSQCFLSKEQIREIALGLEASQQPFLWALTFPPSLGNGPQGYLPEGFEDRIMNRGLVANEWVPQREILSHPSTGGFVTHCGWNSILEAMGVGLPLIALPMQLDQGLNARLIVEELKVGVEVGRGDDGSLIRDEICKAVRMAMVEEEGRAVRVKAAEMGDLFRTKILQDGSQKAYIEQFIKYLHLLKSLE